MNLVSSRHQSTTQQNFSSARVLPRNNKDLPLIVDSVRSLVTKTLPEEEKKRIFSLSAVISKFNTQFENTHSYKFSDNEVLAMKKNSSFVIVSSNELKKLLKSKNKSEFRSKFYALCSQAKGVNIDFALDVKQRLSLQEMKCWIKLENLKRTESILNKAFEQKLPLDKIDNCLKIRDNANLGYAECLNTLSKLKTGLLAKIGLE